MPPDLIQRLTLQGGIVPGAVSLILLGVLWWLHRRKAGLPRDDGESVGDGPRWLLPVLLAGGFFAADYVVKGSFEWWPTDNTKRAAHAALLLGVFGMVEGLVRLPRWAVALGRALVFGALAWMLCEGYAPNTISTADLWGIVAICAILGSLIAHASDHGTEASPGWAGALAWVVAVGAVQPLFHLGGFSGGSMALAGVLAVLSSTLIVSVFVKDVRLSRGGVTVIVGLLLAGLLGVGVQTGTDRVPALLLIAGVPLVFVLDAGGAKRSLLVRVVAIAAIAGTAAALLSFGGSGVEDSDEADPYADFYGG